jgi:SNF2 family DNA or RNA helicase
VVAHAMSDSRDGRFSTLVLRNADTWIDTSLLRPVIIHDTLVCQAPPNIGVLREFITPAAMEALHAGDTAGALAALGLKAASKETLADRVTESLRGDLVQAEKILAFKRDIDYSTAAAKILAIEKSEAKVARIREQLASLESRILTSTAELCPICYDTPRTTTLTPCCRQAFCLSCLCECISSKPICPLCRQKIGSIKDLLVLGEDAVASPSAVESSTPTKGAALLNLLSNSTEDQRYLVFSAHEASFKGLREVLASRGIRCELLQGTAARVEGLRKKFREGRVRILCMNARHVGAGINLEAATHVVLYHRMNLELERQVIGRAVRFERAAELRVVHLVHEEETAYNGMSSSEVIVHV